MNSENFLNPTSSYVVGTHSTVDTAVGTYTGLPNTNSITILKTVENIFVFVQNGNTLVVTSSNYQITAQCDVEIRSIYVSTDYIAAVYIDGSLEVFSILPVEKRVGLIIYTDF